MRSLFTIHGGEYLVGSKLESHERKPNVWIPSKDIGVDLLVSCKKSKNTSTIQVKFSKDYNIAHGGKDGFLAGGWWQFKPDKILQSTANYWVLVLYSATKTIQTYYIVIKPAILLRRLQSLRGNEAKTLNTYLQVYKESNCITCIETRQMKKAEKQCLNQIDKRRDFTEFLDGKLDKIFEDWD